MFRIAADVKRISGRCAPQNALNRCKSLIPIDISCYFALIASFFEQRVFKETYEKPLSVRYINYYQFRSEPAAKFVSHVK